MEALSLLAANANRERARRPLMPRVARFQPGLITRGSNREECVTEWVTHERSAQ